MKSEQLRNEPLHFITDTISFQYLFLWAESIFKEIQRQKLTMTTKGKEARWTPPEESLCDWTLGPEDEEYALILNFVYKCANCTRKQQSKKILIAVKEHSDLAFSRVLPNWIQAKMCWQTYLGVDEIEMRLC
jgi:hypothetical protein